MTEKPAACPPLPVALCSSSTKDPVRTKPEGLSWFHSYSTILNLLSTWNKTHIPILYGYLQQTVGAHGSVAGPVTFICGSIPEAVTPLFNHVEALGVPNVCLQPHVLPLTPVELQQQVSMPTAGLAALALCLFLLLRASLKALLPLWEEEKTCVTDAQRGKVRVWNKRQSVKWSYTFPELYHSVGHVSQSPREPLGVVAHSPSPHVLGQGSEHVAAACCFGDGFQHGAHFCCPGLSKRTSWVEMEAWENFNRYYLDWLL